MFETLNSVRLIEEVKARPGLYRTDMPADKEDKLMLWKEIGAALFEEWETYSKATAYDIVLQLQKKWRSLRDAYNRELRARRTGVRINARCYMHFKRLSFLGGYEGELSEDDDNDETEAKPVKVVKPKYRPKKRKAESSSDNEEPPEEFEIPSMPVYPSVEVPDNDDPDKLFLLSFLPEIRQLPPKIKMWARAQIAQIMQEAVTTQYNESVDSIQPSRPIIKSSRSESND